jgi:hypothetical protein
MARVIMPSAKVCCGRVAADAQFQTLGAKARRS